MDFQCTNYSDEAALIDSIEKKINPQLPDDLNNQEFIELVETYQVHDHSRSCWKHNKFLLWSIYFTGKRIIAKPFDFEFSSDEVSAWRNTLLRQIRSYIDDNLNPAKVNVVV